MAKNKTIISLSFLIGIFVVSSCSDEKDKNAIDLNAPPPSIHSKQPSDSPSDGMWLRLDDDGNECLVNWKGDLLVEETKMRRNALKHYAITGEYIDPFARNESQGNLDWWTQKTGSAPTTSSDARNSCSASSSSSSSPPAPNWGELANDPQVRKFVAEGVAHAARHLTGSESKPVHVESYKDKNGRYVPEHNRSLPSK